eukprot:5908637-Pyramimonas_sp.AAC.1
MARALSDSRTVGGVTLLAECTARPPRGDLGPWAGRSTLASTCLSSQGQRRTGGEVWGREGRPLSSPGPWAGLPETNAKIALIVVLVPLSPSASSSSSPDTRREHREPGFPASIDNLPLLADPPHLLCVRSGEDEGRGPWTGTGMLGQTPAMASQELSTT